MKQETKPNFIVAGAAKSGTTSLFHYLNTHPDIYIPEVKECRFFSQLPKDFKGLGAEFFQNSGITDKNEYFALFNGHENKVCGDISNDYLYYYMDSIRNIKKYLGGDVKILLLLRNPIDRAYSNYMHAYRDDWEELSFEQAIIEETIRIKNNWAWPYHYIKVGFYYNQVKEYLENFSNVKVFLYDELKDIQLFMDNIFSFLEVDSIKFSTNATKHNKSGYPKSNIIHKLVNNYFVKKISKPIEDKIFHRNILSSIKNINLINKPLSKNTRIYLEEIYKSDIKNLSQLIDKDLTHWVR